MSDERRQSLSRICADIRSGSLIAELVNVEQAAVGADIRFAQVVDTIDDSRAACTSDTVVVGLANAADGGNGRVCFQQVMLSEVCRGKRGRIESANHIK